MPQDEPFRDEAPSARELLKGGLASLRRIVLVMVLAYAVAALLRYGLIEREDLGLLCESPDPPLWCAARLLIIRAFLVDAFGIASLVLVAVALWRRSGRLALAALALGTVGMVLYKFTWSGVGVLGGLLLAGRLQADRDQDRERGREHRQAPGG
jgi:glycerol uptake facilitator-like aquaporin